LIRIGFDDSAGCSVLMPDREPKIDPPSKDQSRQIIEQLPNNADAKNR
jgi:hypothetical protein